MLCSADVTEHMHNPKMLQSWLTDNVGKAIESNFSHYLHRKKNMHVQLQCLFLLCLCDVCILCHIFVPAKNSPLSSSVECFSLPTPAACRSTVLSLQGPQLSTGIACWLLETMTTMAIWQTYFSNNHNVVALAHTAIITALYLSLNLQGNSIILCYFAVFRKTTR